MKIVYCGALYEEPNAPDHLGIQQGFNDLGWDWSIVSPRSDSLSGEAIADQINTINPEFVIHGNADSLGSNICKYISKNIKQIFWMLDYRTPSMLGQKKWGLWKESAPYINTIFVSAKDHVNLWRDAFNTPTYFAPHACWIPSELWCNSDFAYDVLFIGVRHALAPFNARTVLLEQIDRLVPISFVHSSDMDKRNLIWTNMPLYYYSSKIVLDISHFWDNWGYCSGRYWYTATLGACAVTKRFPGCDYFFPDSFKWYFDTAQQAADLIKALLNNDEERARTKRRVSRYAWKNHSYKIRFQQMMLCLETGKQVDMF
jgi:hypothetical protein